MQRGPPLRLGVTGFEVRGLVDDPASRDLLDPWSARAENNPGPVRRPYAREASSARKGFWDWSW